MAFGIKVHGQRSAFRPDLPRRDAARAHFEKLRWPEGRTCPHCGVAGDDPSTLLKGKSHRAGLYKCKACSEPFTGTTGRL
jgi:hypothetical protein